MAGCNIPDRLKPDVVAAGKQYGIPPEVLAGLLDVENCFKGSGVSSAGAVGIAQFLPSTAKGLGVNPRDERSSIFGAANYLHQLGYSKDPMRALGAYNGGPGNPQHSYAVNVMSSAKRLRGQLAGVNPNGPLGAAGTTNAKSGGGDFGSQLLKGFLWVALAGAGAGIAALGAAKTFGKQQPAGASA